MIDAPKTVFEAFGHHETCGMWVEGADSVMLDKSRACTCAQSDTSVRTRRARMRVTCGWLRELLHLPVTAEIVGARYDDRGYSYGNHDVVELVIEESFALSDLTFEQGEELPVVMPVFHSHQPVTFEGWKAKR